MPVGSTARNWYSTLHTTALLPLRSALWVQLNTAGWKIKGSEQGQGLRGSISANFWLYIKEKVSKNCREIKRAAGTKEPENTQPALGLRANSMTLHFNSRFAALFALSNLTVLTRRQCTISQADGVSQVNVELFGNWNGCKSTTIASRKQPTIWS